MEDDTVRPRIRTESFYLFDKPYLGFIGLILFIILLAPITIPLILINANPIKNKWIDQIFLIFYLISFSWVSAHYISSLFIYPMYSWQNLLIYVAFFFIISVIIYCGIYILDRTLSFIYYAGNPLEVDFIICDADNLPQDGDLIEYSEK